MQKTIDKLLEMMFIRQDVKSPWASRITLAPKPHQEAVMNINEYIWRFCINYIQVNIVTRPAEYRIPRCDGAVMYGFGEATFFILLDAYSGYHQVKLSEASAIKTAFSAPHGRKYCWVVMPFGLSNCPVVFIAMMHNLQELWIEMARKEGIDIGLSNGTTIIMDDTFLFGVDIEASFVLARCVCLIARKYHLTWKLKKSQWMLPSIEFVGVDVYSKGGNTPAQSNLPGVYKLAVQAAEAGGWRLEAGGWRLEAGGWRLEAGGWRLEAGGWRLEAGDWRLESD
jgi:hypothetical protein